jgi:Ca2+-binding RTX toxin-like protein
MADYTFSVDGKETDTVEPGDTAFVMDLAFFDTDDTVSGTSDGPLVSLLQFDIAGGISLDLTGYPGITGFDRVEVLNRAATQLVIGQDFWDANARGAGDLEVRIIETGTGIGGLLDASALDASSAVQLFGADGNDMLIGGAGNDFLDGGGAGNDFLDGGAGNDIMRTSDGDDTYIVDSLGDQILFASDPGTDEVVSSIDYDLSVGFQEQENLRLAPGSGAITGIGNNLDNRIRGNGNANSLYGGDGDDS